MGGGATGSGADGHSHRDGVVVADGRVDENLAPLLKKKPGYGTSASPARSGVAWRHHAKSRCVMVECMQTRRAGSLVKSKIGDPS